MLHGLVHDSAALYWGKKALGHVPRISSGRSVPGISLTITNVVIYKPILNFEMNVPEGMVGKWLYKKARDIKTGAARQIDSKSGKLASSLYIERRAGAGSQSVVIGSKLSYAYAHHEGTKPHTIVPDPPNTVVRFRKGSAIIHSREVHHPGTPPNRYLSDQLRLHIR